MNFLRQSCDDPAIFALKMEAPGLNDTKQLAITQIELHLRRNRATLTAQSVEKIIFFCTFWS